MNQLMWIQQFFEQIYELRKPFFYRNKFIQTIHPNADYCSSRDSGSFEMIVFEMQLDIFRTNQFQSVLLSTEYMEWPKKWWNGMNRGEQSAFEEYMIDLFRKKTFQLKLMEERYFHKKTLKRQNFIIYFDKSRIYSTFWWYYFRCVFVEECSTFICWKGMDLLWKKTVASLNSQLWRQI